MMNFKVCEVEAIYKPKIKSSERIKISSSKDAFEVIKKFIDIEEQAHKERIYVILLNNANKVLGISKLSEGGITGCLVDIRLLFQLALTGNAVSFILWHNHPSGILKPSQADIDLSQKIEKASKILDLRFFDHLIIDSENNYRSMRDNLDF